MYSKTSFLSLFNSALLSALLSLALLGAAPTAAVDTHDTRMLLDPGVSSTHVAFIYDGDVWIANLDGSSPRRLSSHPGNENAPRISPDGKMVAFTANYDGNNDVFVVPITGGVPKRLTFHPRQDQVWGFTPDSQAVLFGSPRHDTSRFEAKLFTVSIDGGFPTELPVPRGILGSLSPDATRVAYNPDIIKFRQWKNYRGGTASRIWIQDLKDHSVVEVPQAEGRSNDVGPMWIDDKIYFRSDRNGEFNLFSYDIASQEIVQHTQYEDFPIIEAATGGGLISYEQAGYVHVFNPKTETSNRLKIGIASDLLERRPRWEDGRQFLRNAALSPSGSRAAVEYRGEIITLPAKKGEARNITETTGAHERSPVWSPDGSKVAFFSDESSEYQLHIMPQDGRGEGKVYEVAGHGFYDTPRFSPDGKKLSYIDNSQSIYVLDLESGESERVMTEVVYGPIRTTHHAWSPDSQWLAYTQVTPTYFQVLTLYNIAEKKSYEISQGLADVGEPVFDRSGKYLYFSASTDAGPLRQWFAQSNSDDSISRSLYVAVLNAGEPSPLAPESDEEKSQGDDSSEEESKDGKDENGEAEEGEAEEDEETQESSIDIDGLDQRILALPLGPAIYYRLEGGDGKLFFIEERIRAHQGLFDVAQGGDLKAFDLKGREATQLASGVRNYSLSADGKKMLVQTRAGLQIGNAGAPLKPGDGALDLGDLKVRVDPVAEWEQMYHDVWRLNRDYFYDPNMHGADWPAMREKYAQFLPHLTRRGDLTRILEWLMSELAVGHSRTGGGDERYEAQNIDVGLLGADFEVHENRYRFKKVYGYDLRWNPGLRAPLAEPGINVKAGEYLLAVNGMPLDASENLYGRFEGLVGEVVELKIGNADGSDARVVHVEPIGDEWRLRHMDWVERNFRRVDEATDGRVAYTFVPNTAEAGHAFFKRYFYPQADRDAIIVDDRFNRGGAVADYYIDILGRPLISFWTMRYGGELKTPLAAIHGPKAMLVNENSSSGGDLLPWMFRKYELGKIFGKRTWGGLVGTLGFPILMDGGRFTAPNLGFWTPEEGFGVENVGVPPDVDVEQWPAEVNAGRDPQLEAAIEWILAELEKNPPKTYERPPFPIRVRR